MLDCQTFNMCCTLDTQAEQQQADVPVPRHTLLVRGAWRDDLSDGAGLEAADEVLQRAGYSSLKHLRPGGRSLAGEEGQHILLIERGHGRNLRECVSTLAFPSV